MNPSLHKLLTCFSPQSRMNWNIKEFTSYAHYSRVSNLLLEWSSEQYGIQKMKINWSAVKTTASRRYKCFCLRRLTSHAWLVAVALADSCLCNNHIFKGLSFLVEHKDDEGNDDAGGDAGSADDHPVQLSANWLYSCWQNREAVQYNVLLRDTIVCVGCGYYNLFSKTGETH